MTMGPFPAGAAVVVESTWLSHAAEMAICVVAAMVVFRLETQRRAGEGIAASNGLGGGIGACKKILVHCAPEVAGVVACLTLAALLRARGDIGGPDVEVDNQAAWEEIKRQWPLLITADTLLSLQAMLRVVVYLSVVLRANVSFPVPLADEAASLSFGANLCRGLLLVQSSTYMLDGPLGGNLPAACEIFAIPLLVALGALHILKRSPCPAAAVASCIALLASRHFLALATEAYVNQLFLAAHMLDTLSAFSYLARSLLIGAENNAAGGGIVTGFTHILMATQSSLATYYFLWAFDEAPGLVGAGCPFQVLQVCTMAQLGAYVGAAIVFIAERLEGGVAVTQPVAHAVPQPATQAQALVL